MGVRISLPVQETGEEKGKGMNKIVSYLQESYHELVNKVSWPSWEELQSSTMVVLLSTIIVTLIVWMMDLGGSKILEFYYNMFK